MSTTLTVGGYELGVYGSLKAPFLCLQAVDEHDIEGMQEEMSVICATYSEEAVCVVTFRIRDWGHELSPWQAPPTYGKQPFGGGARSTLDALGNHILPELDKHWDGKPGKRRHLLAGYSLAGLFALWSAYETKLFDGVIAASPSVWYPDWLDYAEARKPKACAIYLSLGDREERTRHPVMCEVGNAIRRQRALLAGQHITHTLVWNPGNHFVDSGKRVGQGILWTVDALIEKEINAVLPSNVQIG